MGQSVFEHVCEAASRARARRVRQTSVVKLINRLEPACCEWIRTKITASSMNALTVFVGRGCVIFQVVWHNVHLLLARGLGWKCELSHTFLFSRVESFGRITLCFRGLIA